MSAPRSVVDVSGDETVWRTLADSALASGSHARGMVGGCVIVAIADVKATELAANGHPLPITATLARDDGRRVYFFTEPNTRRRAER